MWADKWVCLTIDPDVSRLVDAEQLLRVLQSYVNDYLLPVWGVSTLLTLDNLTDQWHLFILANYDRCQCLGYHEYGGDGVAHGLVNVAECQRRGQAISAIASHELAELLTDPAGNLTAFSPRGRAVAIEIADPVQGDTWELDGLPVTNIVTPAWYGQPYSGPFDVLGLVEEPWQVRPGGYCSVYEGGQWSNLFGSYARFEDWEMEDRRGHRTERRTRRQEHPAQ